MESMQDKETHRLTLLALLAATSFVLGRFVQIPIPNVNGYVTLLDAGIFTVSLSLGKKDGAIVGGIAAFLSDLTSGYPQWMFFSLVIHALQGYTGALTKFHGLNWAISGLSMVGGYFLATWYLYGLVAALNPMVNIPNMIQTTIGYLIGWLVAKLLERTGILNGLK
jgi:uncharacterized membrane protein